MKTFITILVIILMQMFCFQANTFAQDTVFIQKPVKQKFTPDPLKATMLAVALPGMGQIYNRKYWKVPLVYGGFGVIGYFLVTNASSYASSVKAYQDFTDGIPQTNSYLKIRGFSQLDPASYDEEKNPQGYRHYKDQLLNFVDTYEQYRNLNFLLIGLWYIASIVDANVDASLFNYDISNNLDIAVRPVQTVVPGGHLSAGANVSIMFNF